MIELAETPTALAEPLLATNLIDGLRPSQLAGVWSDRSRGPRAVLSIIS